MCVLYWQLGLDCCCYSLIHTPQPTINLNALSRFNVYFCTELQWSLKRLGINVALAKLKAMARATLERLALTGLLGPNTGG